MKKRSLVLMILLSIVTLGIYQLYWIYKTRKELVAGGYKIPPFIVLLLPILALVAVVIAQLVVGFIGVSNSLSTSGSYNDTDTWRNIFNVLSIIVGIIAVPAVIPITLYWFYAYCRAVEAVTNQRLSFSLNYVLLIIFVVFGFPFIWPFINQFYFNETTSPNRPVTT